MRDMPLPRIIRIKQDASGVTVTQEPHLSPAGYIVGPLKVLIVRTSDRKSEIGSARPIPRHPRKNRAMGACGNVGETHTIALSAT